MFHFIKLFHFFFYIKIYTIYKLVTFLLLLLLDLTQQVETKNAQIESYKARISELESQTREYDEMYASQKRMLKEVKEEYHEQLRAVESKYETQRSVNKKMEEHILELWQRIEVSRAGITVIYAYFMKTLFMLT